MIYKYMYVFIIRQETDINLTYRITFMYVPFGFYDTNFVIIDSCLSSKPYFQLCSWPWFGMLQLVKSSEKYSTWNTSFQRLLL